MNQGSIVKFILELRREKCLTQMELVNKLGVTDMLVNEKMTDVCRFIINKTAL